MPLACTSLLGDYAIGAGPTTADGGMDGLVARDTSGVDGANDGGEASADASEYLKLSCAEQTGSEGSSTKIAWWRDMDDVFGTHTI